MSVARGCSASPLGGQAATLFGGTCGSVMVAGPNWLCGVMGRLVALLALKPLGLGRGTAVTLPRGCDQGGGVCFRVLTRLAMPQAAHSAIKSCFGVVKNC